MAIRVVEFSNGSKKLERFLPKNQHTQRKLLNFENWVNQKGGVGGPKVPAGQIACHFSQDHAMVTKILDFIHKHPN
jgi:hypothetical protein